MFGWRIYGFTREDLWLGELLGVSFSSSYFQTGFLYLIVAS